MQIFTQAWREGRATLNGTHYTVDDAIVAPRPLQDGGIPLWIAGGGEKVTLRIAAQYAQYTNFDGTFDGFRHKSALLADHCRDVGTDYDAIVRSANYNVAIGHTEAEVEERLARLVARLEPVVGAEKAQGALGAFRGMPGVGTPEQIVEKLSALAAVGMSYGIFYFPRPPTTGRASSCSSARSSRPCGTDRCRPRDGWPRTTSTIWPSNGDGRRTPCAPTGSTWGATSTTSTTWDARS